MSICLDLSADERAKKSAYVAAFPKFVHSLSVAQRRSFEKVSTPDWQGHATFALPVNVDDPAFTADSADPIISTLEELKLLPGALPKIALWISDQVNGLNLLLATEQFRAALARISEAKNPRLESYLVSLAIGMNLLGNSNGYAIAEHFGIRAQTFHEGLTETCKALGVVKPLAKVNKARYKKTQYRHRIKGRT